MLREMFSLGKMPEHVYIISHKFIKLLMLLKTLSDFHFSLFPH
jgi:hypothetical protein